MNRQTTPISMIAWCQDCLEYHAPDKHFPTYYVFVDGVDSDFSEDAVGVRAPSPEVAATRAFREDGELMRILANQGENGLILVVSKNDQGDDPVILEMTTRIALHVRTRDANRPTTFDTYKGA